MLRSRPPLRRYAATGERGRSRGPRVARPGTGISAARAHAACGPTGALRRPVRRASIGEALIDRLALRRPSPTEFVNCPRRSRNRAPAPQPDAAARHGRTSWVASPRPGPAFTIRFIVGGPKPTLVVLPRRRGNDATRRSIPGCPTRFGSVCMFSNSCFVLSHTLVRGRARS